MSKEGSVAPQERVNITYKAATGDAKEEVELPLKILAIGDYTGRADERTVEDRKPINIDKDNFNQVMTEHNLRASISVQDKLSTDAGGEMALSMKFSTLRDFEPEGIAEQVPELRRLLELRSALTALKGPLGNIPAFRKKIQGILGDEGSRSQLLKELGFGE